MSGHQWLLLFLTLPSGLAAPETDDGSTQRELVGFGPSRNAPNTGPQWVDYPAYALSEPPRTSFHGSNEGYGGYGGSGKGLKGKKKGVSVFPSGPGPMPLFDILVEPEYIPDPFPVPYPFPVDESVYPVAPMSEEPPKGHPKARPKYKRMQYIERTDATWVCPKEFVQEGNNCIKMDQVDVDLGCPEGWRYEHGMCRAVDSVAPEGVCDEGYVQWDNKNECVREVIAPKEMKCPPGFVGTVEGCKKNVEAQALAHCAKGELVGTTCRWTSMSQPLATCPHDFAAHHQDSTLCFRELITDGKLICPTPYHVLTTAGTCERKSQRAPELICPAGFQIQGHECFRETLEPATKTCEHGEMSKDGLCVYVESLTPPELLCEVSTTINPATGKCEEQIQIPSERSCPKGFHHDPHTSLCMGKSGPKTDKKKTSGIPASIRCPAGLQLTKDQQHCVGSRQMDPLPHCSHGTQLINGKCEKKVAHNPVLVCPMGSVLLSGQCKHVDTVPAKQVCIPGFTLVDHVDGKTHHHMCEMVESGAALAQCPHGYENSLHGLKCQRLEKVEAALECPPMMTLYRETTSLAPGSSPIASSVICKGEDIMDPDWSCNVAGMQLEFTEHGPICKGVQVEPAAFVCPPTFKDDHMRCLKFEVTPMRDLCPEGYTHSFNICLKEVTQNPVLLCPEGYAHHQPSETCVRKRSTELMPLCPEGGWQYDKLVGECYRMSVQMDFDEAPKPPEDEQLKDMPGVPPPKEDLKDLPAVVPPPREEVRPVQLPAPVFTVIQQPVAIPAPSIILPQQAPVPPPPAIRVPYAQPVPTPVRPKHEIHQHSHHTNVMQVQQKKHNK